MATDCVRKWIRRLTAAALILVAVPAGAVFYSSRFDPVSFSGTALFQFDDACLANDGFYSAAACHLTLVSAHVDIADDGSGGTGQLSFGSDAANMVGLVIEGGTLVGVDTDLIGWVFASPCTGTDCASVPYWIQWVSGFDTDPVFLFNGRCDIAADLCTPFAEPAGVAFDVTFTRVPEPATLALVMGALTAGWLARRRGQP